MKVLVTGASGLLGGGVARSLAARGDDVTVLQRRPSGLGLREVLADIADADTIGAALEGHDAVVHLAAKVDIVGPWSAYERANIDGTDNVVNSCLRSSVSRLVQVSTPAVAHGGKALVGVGATRADIPNARGHYARSKAIAERIALSADGANLAVVAIRPHLVWGPGDTQLIGRIVERARSGRLALVGSGAALIDTTYVDNAIDALVHALDRCEVAHGQALVVSNGEPRTVAELVSEICRAAGVEPPQRHVPQAIARLAGAAVEGAWATLRRTDTPPMTRFLAEQLSTAHWFDQRHTREVLDWSPRISLAEGLRLLAASYRSGAAVPR